MLQNIQRSLLIFHLTAIGLKDREIWDRYDDTEAVTFGQKELETSCVLPQKVD